MSEVKSSNIRFRKQRGRRQRVEQKFSVKVLLMRRSPAKRRLERTGAGDGVDKGAGHKFSRRAQFWNTKSTDVIEAKAGGKRDVESGREPVG